MGDSDSRQMKAARLPAVVPPFALSGGLPTFTVKRYWSPSTTGCTYASLPALLERMKVEASGTSAWR